MSHVTCFTEMDPVREAKPNSKRSFNFSHLAYRAQESTDRVSSGTAASERTSSEEQLSCPKRRKISVTSTTASASPSKSPQSMEALKDVRLSDFLSRGLDIIIVGYNPGKNSASHGHHYAGPGNHFWKALYQSGLIPEPLTFRDDARITEFGIGLTNIVARPSPSSSDLSKAELRDGAVELRTKIVEYEPKMVVFNGVGIYEVFSGSKGFVLGKQDQVVKGRTGRDIVLYVMPSSSPRGSKWPRIEDKLKFYHGIYHLRDYINGKTATLEMERVVFP